MLSKAKDKLGALVVGLLVAAVAGVAAFAIPATAQPVASASQAIQQQVRQALGLANRANRVAVGANKRAIQGIRLARQAQGTAGPQGPKGDTGARGQRGPRGFTGATGPSGQNGDKGDSVEVSGTAPGCAEGGATVQVEGQPGTAEEVCNGEKGDPGDPGDNSPFADAGGTLPSGTTLKGTWAFGPVPAGTNLIQVPISFPIPLPGSGTVLGNTEVHVIGSNGNEIGGPNAGEPQAACTGNAHAISADPGHLCVRIAQTQNASITVFDPAGFGPGPRIKTAGGTAVGASPSGAVIQFDATHASNPGSGHGTFAVTAP